MASANLNQVLRELKKHGLLLQTDAQLPNVASLFASEAVHGSWWKHPRAQEIFVGLNQLEDHQDVLFTKLLSGKVTLVHRRLWRELLSIASSGESWQLRKLSSAANFLLQKVDESGSLRSDKIAWPARFGAVKIGDVIRETETRLLLHTEQFHTESGAHAKLLENWEHWSERTRFKENLRPFVEAKQVLEEIVSKLNRDYEGKARLPWN
jgi:hypothetical protein